MAFVNSLMTGLFDVLFRPFRSLDPWWSMIVVSLLTGLLMLFVFRLTSNQAGIRAVKDRIKAHLLEMRLFKDNLRVTLGSQRRILAANLKYVGYSAKPMLAMIIPLVLILVQLNVWFGYEPLTVGEPVIVKVRLAAGADPLKTDLGLEAPPSIRVETPPLRLEKERETDWRIKPESEGVARLRVSGSGVVYEKSIVVGGPALSRLEPVRAGRGFFEELLHPGEAALPAGGPVRSIEVVYPERRLPFLGLRLHWLVAYFALSIVLGYGLKRPLKVEI
jgi:uncharacterized membrane protein (DUF106 family)